MTTVAELRAEWSSWSVQPYRGLGYGRFNPAYAGMWVVGLTHVRLGRLLEADNGVLVVHKTEDDALSRCFALNLEDRHIFPHRFEPNKLTGRNRVPRCIHCGLLNRHARAHPRM